MRLSSQKKKNVLPSNGFSRQSNWKSPVEPMMKIDDEKIEEKRISYELELEFTMRKWETKRH